jgi:ribosomal protein L28
VFSVGATYKNLFGLLCLKSVLTAKTLLEKHYQTLRSRPRNVHKTWIKWTNQYWRIRINDGSLKLIDNIAQKDESKLMLELPRAT